MAIVPGLVPRPALPWLAARVGAQSGLATVLAVRVGAQAGFATVLAARVGTQAGFASVSGQGRRPGRQLFMLAFV